MICTMDYEHDYNEIIFGRDDALADNTRFLSNYRDERFMKNWLGSNGAKVASQVA